MKTGRGRALPGLLLTLLLGLLLACSAPPGRNYTDAGLQETLETEILPNSSKMFVYRLRLPQEAMPSHVRIAEGPRRARPGVGGIEINRNTSRRLEENTAHVVATLGYCREGFLRLDQSISPYHLWVRGECREGATPEDRQRFGQKNTLTVSGQAALR